MDLTRINIYQRLRDFDVPAAILDEIFSHEEEVTILETAWKELETAGLKGDAIAQEVARMIFEEMDDYPDQNFTEK